MFRQRLGLLLVVLSLVPFAPLAAAGQSGEDAGFVPVTDAMLENPAPGDWLMWRRTQNGWGFRWVYAIKCLFAVSYGFARQLFPSLNPSF